MTERPLLRIEDLAVSFPVIGEDSRTRRRVRAVSRVSLTVYPRQTLAVVGESGCGKSVSALSTLRLVPQPAGRYEAGRILWHGDESLPPGETTERGVDLLRVSERQMRSIRGSQIAMIFQEPMTSLNPVFTIGFQVCEAIRLHQRVSRSEARRVACGALEAVGIADPAARLREYPHQLSGGMRQRVMIAMALACRPSLLLADEPTTALDVTIQAQILDLLRTLQRVHHMAVMLITHDLGVVAETADVVAVMYAGRVVEYGSVFDVFAEPLHPYTRGLFNSMPVLGRSRERLEVIDGQVPNLAADALEPAVDRMGRDTGTLTPADPTCADVIERDGRATRVFRATPADQPELREVKPGHWAASFDAPGYDAARVTPPDLAFRRPQAVTV